MNDHTKDRHAHQATAIQFQARNYLHRALMPQPEDRRERTTALEAAGVALAFILAACIVVALIGWGWQELRSLDLSPLALIGWSPT